MNVDKYCEDGLLFDVVYKMEMGNTAISKFMFPIDYTKEDVEKELMAAPHNLNIVSVHEIGYILKLKEQVVKHS